MLPSFSPALLALADGTVFRGQSIGAPGSTIGEVVFNTAITGYQEILTDPSYARQIVTLTYPHIGNYGVNAEDVEATKVHAAGLIIRDLPVLASNFRSEQSLSDYLKAQGVVAIAGIDTRKLTRILREKGAQNGCILAGSRRRSEGARPRALVPGSRGHGPREGRVDARRTTNGRRPNGVSAAATASRKRRSFASSRSTTASSSTSCACWPSAVAT